MSDKSALFLEMERYSGRRPGVSFGSRLKGWHGFEPRFHDSVKASRVRTSLFREKRKPTREELYWLPGWERRYALLKQFGAWEQELERRAANRVEEHGGLGWRGDAMREQLEEMKRGFEPLFKRYIPFLQKGDLDDPRCHLAMVVVQMQGATTMQQFSRLTQELHRLKGQYESRLTVNSTVSGVAAVDMAKELLAKLESSELGDVLQFPSSEKGG